MYAMFLLLCSFAGLLLLSIGTAGQTQADPWMRVQTDDGEFSIEIPRRYTYFFNKTGFSIAELGTSNTYDLKNMRMVNGYIDDTLVSVECYEAGKSALNAIYKDDDRKASGIQSSERKLSGYTIRQLEHKAELFYSVRQYFHTRKNIYVLTAASRSSETAAVKRFFESVNLRAKDAFSADPGVPKLSSLRSTDPEIEIKLDKEVHLAAAPKTPPTIDERRKGLIIIHKSRPAYTESARMKGVTGTIVVRAKFENTGNIDKITVVKTLPEGLLRQVFFAAMRLKFLPSMENGTPQTVDKAIEYSFSIY